MATGIGKAGHWLGELCRQMVAVRAETGRPIRRQLGDMLFLKRRARHFGLSDYFDFRLYTPEQTGGRPLEHVAGWRMLYWLDDRLNPPGWRNLAFDKLVMYTLLAAGGVPIPTLAGLYERAGRRFFQAPNFTRLEDLGHWLRTSAPYPLFAKPVHGDVGSGDYALCGYRPEDDSLLQVGGEPIAVPSLLAAMDQAREFVRAGSGYLFQTQLRQHPTLRERVGEAISSVRVIVLVDENGPRPFRATWKIVANGNITDNYHWGRAGNLLGAINLDSGRLWRVVRGYGMAQECLTHHPETGAELSGLILPDWPMVLDLVCRGARLFPMLPFQHWDVALTETGPVVLEINVTGGTYMHQFASGEGLYDPVLQRLVARQQALDRV